MSLALSPVPLATRFRQTIALVLACAVASTAALAGDKDAKWKKLHPDELAPLQDSVGYAQAQQTAAEWIADARGSVANPGNRKAVAKALTGILNRIGNAGYEGYRLRDGSFRPDDGHHKLKAALIAMDEYDIPMEDVNWSLKIPKENDLRKLSWKETAGVLSSRKVGYFSPEKVATYSKRYGADYLEYLYRDLPRNFDEIGDSPMRSAMGELFKYFGIKGSEVDPQLQLALGDKAEALGIQIKGGEEYAPGTLSQLVDAFFNQGGSTLLSSLLEGIRPDRRAALETQLLRQRDLLRRAQGKEGCILRLLVAIHLNPNMPESVKLPSSLRDFNSLYEKAAPIGPDEQALGVVARALHQLAEGKPLNKSMKTALKQIRKSGVALRSANRLFSDSMSDTYRIFVRDLGDLNEDLATKNFDSPKDRRAIQQRAQDLSDLLDDVPGGFRQDFKPFTSAEFRASQSGKLDWIDETLRLSEQTSAGSRDYLTVKRYHDLRNYVRDYKTFFDLLVDRDPTNLAYHNAAAKLGQLSRHMGKIKDGIIRAPAGGGKSELPVLKQPTEVDPDTLQDLRDFSAMMRASLQSNGSP